MNLNEQKKPHQKILSFDEVMAIFRPSQKRIEIFPRDMTSLEHRGSKSVIIFFKTSPPPPPPHTHTTTPIPSIPRLKIARACRPKKIVEIIE